MQLYDYDGMDMVVSKFPMLASDSVPWISEADMIEVDRAMIEDLHIELLQMMENAGRHLARLVLESASPKTVTVAAGSGGNGGGGLVAARHLANSGVEVVVAATRPKNEMTPVAAHQRDILERMGVEFVDELRKADVVIDALIGYSLKGAPRGVTADLVEATAGAAVVVALDTPSGLNVSSGAVPGRAVRADATMTLALPKAGMRTSDLVGELYLADISVPPSITDRFGSHPLFTSVGISRIVES